MKTFIVTGSSKGIGQQVCNDLLNKGHRVIGISRSAVDSKPNFIQYPLDLAQSPLDLTGLIKHTENEIKCPFSLDGIVLNAGQLTISPISTLKMEDLRLEFQVNLFSCFELVQGLLEYLKTSKGRVVLVSSGASTSPYPTWSSYCCSKAAGNMLMQCLAKEYDDITTLSIRPGVVDTQMQAKIRGEGRSVMPPDVYAKFTGLHEAGKLVDATIPAAVISNAVEFAEKELSGNYYSYEDLLELLQG